MTKTPHNPHWVPVHTALVKIGFLLLIPLVCFAPAALGQALPAAEASPVSTGFSLPSVEGSLRYGVSVNESISDGYYGNSGISSQTGLNGDLAYISPSKIYPFSMVFSGGHYWSTSGQPSTLFLNLGLSQVVATRNWNFLFADSVSYLPDTASTGLSGVPGTGDLGVPPIQIGDNSGQGVLTGYSTRVNNLAAISAQRTLTGKTSLQLSGNYSILRFVGSSSNGGLDTSNASGTIGLNHRLDARNSIGGSYAYIQNTYGANQPGFVSQTASMQYTHQFTRQLNMNLSVGPQWTGGTNTALATSTTPAIPTSVSVYANALLGYTTQYNNFSLNYSRGSNAGSGVVAGAHSDSVTFTASRTFDRVWNCAANAAYTHTTSLAPVAGGGSFTSQTEIGAIQASRALVRSLSAYASYTLENQSTPASSAALNAFSGLFQVASFGLTYSPNPLHFGPR